jgi:3-oxoacyl-[acyl-carrier-protein] synthase-3
MDIGITAIGVYVPELRIDNVKDSERFGMDPAFVTDKIGFRRIAKKDESQETSDLAVLAVEDLEKKHPFARDSVECLVLVTQNPDGHGIPHTSAVLHRKLGLGPSCVVFDISLGCSGYVHGLSVIKAFMEANAFQVGLLVTSDPYSKVIDHDDRDTFPLFGDGATATLLTEDPAWTLGRFDFGTRSATGDAITVTPAGQLHMIGRAVFNFAAVEVPKSIERALQANDLRREDLHALVLHQGSKYIADTIAKKLGMEQITVFCSADYGNTVSSSIPLAISVVDPGVKSMII